MNGMGLGERWFRRKPGGVGAGTGREPLQPIRRQKMVYYGLIFWVPGCISGCVLTEGSEDDRHDQRRMVTYEIGGDGECDDQGTEKIANGRD